MVRRAILLFLTVTLLPSFSMVAPTSVAAQAGPWCAKAPTRIEVDIATQSVYVYENGRMINSVVRGISTANTSKLRYHYGRKRNIIPYQPRGCFKVHAKRPSTYSSAYRVTIYNTVWFIGSLYSFHTVPAGKAGNLSKPDSGGCIRLPVRFSRWFYRWVEIGTPVYIHGYWDYSR